MASDLATALLSGQGSALAADPAFAQVIPQLSLAQAMTQQGLSGEPAYPAQALGRLAQTLVGSRMMDEATGQLSGVYGGAAESLKRVFPEGTTLGDMLRSDNPYVRMMAMQQASKAALLNTETKTLGPEQTVVAPATPRQGGGVVAAGSPALAGAAEGAKAGAKAPYESGGTATIPGGLSGTQEVPITAETRRRMQPGGDLGPVNPLRIGGQPQNLTGPEIPPGGTNAAPAPGRPKAPPSEPAASVTERIDAAYGGKPVQTPELKAREEQFGAAGKALGGVIAEHIEAGGRTVRDRINALDTIESAMRTNEGKGIVTGPHAENILKLRETLDGMGINTDWIKTGMAQSEMIQKMNAQLASASAKAMTGRPTQFEFSSWQKNNPGLATSREGSLALIDVLRQTAHQDIELGKLAQNKKNWENWPEVVDKYYADPKHALINPLTGKPMRDEIAAARGGVRGGAEEGTPTASGGRTGTTSTGIQWSVR